jgi:intracellular septation protein A
MDEPIANEPIAEQVVAAQTVASEPVAAEAVAAEALAAEASPGAMLRQAGPRIVRDVLGPTLTFYAGYKLVGLLVGIVLASVFALGAFAYERHHGRPGIIARVVLGFVVLQAIIGVIAHSATIYLAQPVLLEGAQALVWLGSVAIGKPIASLFAGELFNVPEEVRSSETFRQVFSRVSLTFGCYFAVAGCIQLVVLLAWGVDTFVVLRVASSIGLAGLIAWAVHYAFASFRASEWGPLLTPGTASAD